MEMLLNFQLADDVYFEIHSVFRMSNETQKPSPKLEVNLQHEKTYSTWKLFKPSLVTDVLARIQNVWLNSIFGMTIFQLFVTG